MISPAVPAVVARYEAALAQRPSPRVVSFQYVVDQTGARDLLASHRIFRSGQDVRDEVLSIDGRRLAQPAVRIFHGRPDRYAVEALAPRTSAYSFRLIGRLREGRQENDVFATTPRRPGRFRVTRVIIDGVSHLPTVIDFATSDHDGTGTVMFVREQTYWVPVLALARATYARLAARERITFSLYRFPTALPRGTFFQPNRIHADH